MQTMESKGICRDTYRNNVVVIVVYALWQRSRKRRSSEDGDSSGPSEPSSVEDRARE